MKYEQNLPKEGRFYPCVHPFCIRRSSSGKVRTVVTITITSKTDTAKASYRLRMVKFYQTNQNDRSRMMGKNYTLFKPENISAYEVVMDDSPPELAHNPNFQKTARR